MAPKIILPSKGYLNLFTYQNGSGSESPIIVKNPPTFTVTDVDCDGFEANLQATLRLRRQNFLPGENISFEFVVKNNTEDAIWRMTVSLLQRTEYVAQKVTKCTESVVAHAVAKDRFFYGQDTTCGRETTYESALLLPRNLMPTFCPKIGDKKTIAVHYFVRVNLSRVLF